MKRSASLARTGFKRAPYERTPAPVIGMAPGANANVRMATADSFRMKAEPVAVKVPRSVREVPSIRESARNEECTVRIEGACNFDPATTVWSHWPGLDAGRGMGIKSLDAAGAYACAACHDVVDGRAPLPPGATPQSVMLDWHAGHMRSLVKLVQKGIL